VSVTLRFRKACGCQSTASGPKIIIRGGKPYGEDPRVHPDTTEAVISLAWSRTTGWTAFVRFACDLCDTEWIEVPRG